MNTRTLARDYKETRRVGGKGEVARFRKILKRRANKIRRKEGKIFTL